MLKQKTFIEHDFQLPDHTAQLQKAEEVINELKTKLSNVKKNKLISNEVHTCLFEEIIRILDYVGKLSISAFDIEEEITSMYVLRYKKSPELGKKLCNDHYESIHRPYTLLKNRCFRMLEDLDNEYIRMYKCNPPNWNI